MKRKIMIFMTGLLLVSGSVFAQGISIDSAGNINVGANNQNGSLEVTGEPDSDGIVSTATGIGTALHGTNADNTGGFAGYFEGNVQVTGHLNVQGTITGESDPEVGTLTNGKWCIASGSQIHCTSDAPGGGSETDPTVAASVKDGVDWSELSGIPEDFADGVDDIGSGGTTGVCNQTCVDDFDARIAALEATVAALDALLTNFSRSGNDIYITSDNLHVVNANLHVENGTDTTDGAPNGKGNIIIGYNEPPGLPDQTGSHNLVVGKNHNYSSYGGIVVGFTNTISAPYASVSGGQFNTASGSTSSVSGGAGNTASAFDASVSGGDSNTASDSAASVSGGQSNTASGAWSTVSGGLTRSVSGNHDWRAGGLAQAQ